jgi:hypothetical protein
LNKEQVKKIIMAANEKVRNDSRVQKRIEAYCRKHGILTPEELNKRLFGDVEAKNTK